MFDKLLEIPKKKVLRNITIIAAVLTVIIWIIFMPIEGIVGLATNYAGTIFTLELAFIPAVACALISAWSTAGVIQLEIFGTYLDFAFIIAYSITAWGLVLLVTRSSEGKRQQLGLVFSIFPFLAGICDVIENIHLLMMMGNTTACLYPNIPFVASICASIKFALLVAVIIYVLVGKIT